MSEFKREELYTVLKNDDILRHLDDNQLQDLKSILRTVRKGRREDGRDPAKKYVVISDGNREAYEEAWGLVEKYYGEGY